MTDAVYASSSDFALALDDGTTVIVEAQRAVLAFDRKRLTAFQDSEDKRRGVSSEEVLIAPGGRVLVRGKVIRGESGGPYRASARIIATRWHPVTVGLLGEDPGGNTSRCKGARDGGGRG